MIPFIQNCMETITESTGVVALGLAQMWEVRVGLME